MTPTETVLLTEYVRACCPQQAIGEYTPDAWHDLLGDLSLAECKQAVAAIARRQPFVAPSEIRAEACRVQASVLPHSQACRAGDHRDCAWSWCRCTCHPVAVPAAAVREIGSAP
jgi:hypothetical protein